MRMVASEGNSTGTDATASANVIRAGWAFYGFAIIVLIEVAIIIATFREDRQSSITTAALFAVLTGSAVAIERVIELIWTMVGLLKGSWWPLTNVSRDVNKLVTDVTTTIQPFYDQANSLIEKLKAGTDEAKKQAEKAEEVLKGIEDDLDRIRKLTASNQSGMSIPHFNVYVDATSTRVEQLRELLKGAGELSPLADQALEVLSTLVGSFKDNPGRRLLSLFAGIIMGLAVAAFLGLDIFQLPTEQAVNAAAAATATATATATAATTAVADATPNYFPKLVGVIVSGLVIGLGSSPAHEIVKLVQETKRRFKGDNNSGSESSDKNK